MPPSLPDPMPDGSADVAILPRLPLEQVDAATALLLEAFPRKLPATVGRGAAGLAALAACFEPAQWLAACEGERLVGLCGLSARRRPSLHGRLGHLVRTVGWWRALRARVGIVINQHGLDDDTLYIQQLAVAADRRGRGIGARLLGMAAERARQEGRRRLQLTVVDSNPRARALYERLGFVAIRTRRMPYMRRWLGYSAVTRMELRLGGEES